MTKEKEISKDSYVWGHVGVIIYHSLLAILLIVSQYLKKNIGRNIVIFSALVLLITALLSLWPILKDYDKIVIE